MHPRFNQVRPHIFVTSHREGRSTRVRTRSEVGLRSWAVTNSFSMATSDSEDSFHTASTSYSESEYDSDSTSNDGNGPQQIQPYMFEPSSNGLAPTYLAEMFSSFSDTSKRELRNTRSDLEIPMRKSANNQKCFSYKGATMWNWLSLGSKLSLTLKTFKKSPRGGTH